MVVSRDKAPGRTVIILGVPEMNSVFMRAPSRSYRLKMYTN